MRELEKYNDNDTINTKRLTGTMTRVRWWMFDRLRYSDDPFQYVSASRVM